MSGSSIKAWRALAVALEQRLDDEFVDGHVRAVEGGELLRQRPEVAGLNAVAVHQARDLDTAVGRLSMRPVLRTLP